MTRHEKFVEYMKSEAEKAGRELGVHAQAATRRPADYCELSEESQWAIDDDLGILDWDGSWDK